MSIANSWSLRFTVNTNSYLRIDITPTFFPFNQTQMIEVSLFGIVLGLIPITLAGLFVTAYLQYRRGDQLDI
ncbi:putative cytochrome b6/f complex, subunit 5 [Medicago truncatula]|nr:putative cytochrome b6/f complex, subunit 5 [Medicago truncatula]